MLTSAFWLLFSELFSHEIVHMTKDVLVLTGFLLELAVSANSFALVLLQVSKFVFIPLFVQGDLLVENRAS